MNQLCKVCGEPAAGFHFGAFTCEGCKSFFGRTYNNISAIAGCKNNGDCVINKKNRTACKACRLRKCLLVGMSKSGSRYGRRSNWFKIHCLLQEQQQQIHPPVLDEGVGGCIASTEAAAGEESRGSASSSLGAAAVNFGQLARMHQIQARQTYQDKTNPCIQSANMSPTYTSLSQQAASLSQQAAAVAVATVAAAAAHQQPSTPKPLPRQSVFTEQPLQHLHPNYQLGAAKFLNGVNSSDAGKTETRLSAATPSDSGASSAGDAADDCHSSRSNGCVSNQSTVGKIPLSVASNTREEDPKLQQHQLFLDFPDDFQEKRRQQFLQIFRSHSEPQQMFTTTRIPFASFAISNLPPPPLPALTLPMTSTGTATDKYLPGYYSAIKLTQAECDKSENQLQVSVESVESIQQEPIDLSLRAHDTTSRHSSHSPEASSVITIDKDDNADSEEWTTDTHDCKKKAITRPTPLDLTLTRVQSLTG